MNPRWVVEGNGECSDRNKSRSPPLMRDPDVVTAQEIDAIANLAQTRLNIFAKELRTFFYSHWEELQHMVASKQNGKAVPVEVMKAFDYFFSTMHCKFVETTIDCSSIAEEDKQKMLQSNCQMLTAIGHSVHFDVGGENAIFLGRALETAKEMMENRAHAEGPVPSRSLAEMMESREPWRKAHGFTYEQFYPPSWVGDPVLEKVHKENGAKVGEWFEGKVDQVQYFLLSMIIIFSASFLHLSNPTEVEATQMTYARALQR